jgi:hypothetical protein
MIKSQPTIVTLAVGLGVGVEEADFKQRLVEDNAYPETHCLQVPSVKVAQLEFMQIPCWLGE